MMAGAGATAGGCANDGATVSTNNNNNNTNAIVYSVVIMSLATARIHPVHMMNVAQHQVVANLLRPISFIQ